MYRRAVLVVLLCGSVMLQGCLLLIAGGAGVGTVAYIRGELQTTYSTSLDRTWAAALGALKDLQIPVHKMEKDALGGAIKAKRAGGTKVKIALESSGPRMTVVKIRVGIFGDEDTSRAINGRIARRLGMKAGSGALSANS